MPAMVVPAMIETTRDDLGNRAQCRPDLGEHLRLHGEDQCGDGADVLHIRIEADAFGCERLDLVGDIRVDHDGAFGIEAAGDPARQHCAAHLAGAGQHDVAVDGVERA